MLIFFLSYPLKIYGARAALWQLTSCGILPQAVVQNCLYFISMHYKLLRYELSPLCSFICVLQKFHP